VGKGIQTHDQQVTHARGLRALEEHMDSEELGKSRGGDSSL